MLLLLSAILGCLASSSIASEGRILTERDLRRFLFADYDKLVRPVTDPNNAIVVYASITPIAIKNLDENDQVLVMDSWMKMKWNDEYLKWDPKEFNNITVLHKLFTANSDNPMDACIKKNSAMYHIVKVIKNAFFEKRNV
ncbi:neuronal acetylcholine receptor subunit alpha-7 [Nephila pilipes]|uniref:Neuronal acetylcholine receptor subunit alpha-7 n=1 Tax=Nephila pilipes TaxID=299642 RepID=A0A8X6TXM2_NEPPI|nr:neuronal acetylcholine receptor subunit alpha-7 [Nephila pilipes]GFT57258.1 neuronal acetylcholine receptor subunit alpha-7 [Nephila pilipes]